MIVTNEYGDGVRAMLSNGLKVIVDLTWGACYLQFVLGPATLGSPRASVRRHEREEAGRIRRFVARLRRRRASRLLVRPRTPRLVGCGPAVHFRQIDGRDRDYSASHVWGHPPRCALSSILGAFWAAQGTKISLIIVMIICGLLLALFFLIWIVGLWGVNGGHIDELLRKWGWVS